jgi:aspartate racemase
MKWLGMLGGMSWESTATYYKLINQGVAARRGGLHSAPLLLASVDFAAVAALQAAGDWEGAARLLGQAGAGLRQAGAGALLIATNTMHRVADEVVALSGLPLLHIADATGAALAQAGVARAAFLGTRFSMQHRGIVIDRIEAHGSSLWVPDADEHDTIHRIIFDELCRGVLRDESRSAFVAIIERQRRRGADAVVLGCTEIGLLIDDHCSPLPCFDTTVLHAQAAVDWLTTE